MNLDRWAAKNKNSKDQSWTWNRSVQLARSLILLMMGIPLVCYCLAVPKPVIAFCRLLSAARDAALLMLAVVGHTPPGTPPY
jgi:hypothetical protein